MTPDTGRRSPDALLPLKPVDFLILLTLARADRHGYGIMQDIERQTDGAVRLEAGSLYRSMRRLLDEAVVVESGRRPVRELDDERRRYYRLTAFGRRVLSAEALRLRWLVREAEALRVIEPDPAS